MTDMEGGEGGGGGGGAVETLVCGTASVDVPVELLEEVPDLRAVLSMRTCARA